MTEFSGSQFGCLQCHCHVLREEIGDEVIKKMGQLKFSGRLSKQAGCFGTYCILNRTVLDNLIYMIKRTDWRSCCWLERLRSGRLLVPKQNSCTRRLSSITDCSNCCGHTPHREHWGHPSSSFCSAPPRAAPMAPPGCWGCPKGWTKPAATIQNAMPHTWTLPSSQNSAHHYGVNASGGLKHSDT